MMTPEQQSAARNVFDSQAEIVRNQIRHLFFQAAAELLFTLGGMVTMAEAVDGWQTNLTTEMRATYTQLWDDLQAAKRADIRRTTMWEDAC